MNKTVFAPEQIEHVPTSSLTPYARNTRTHSPQQIKQIAASIKEFGFINPIIVDANNTIIAGHGRLAAAEHLQLDSVPCVRVEHMTETQRRAYVIADNKLALNAGWDEELLKIELDSLHEDGFNLEIVGFDANELSAAMGLDDPAEVTEDEVPEPPSDPMTKPGDLWLLGEHRVLCGDSTNAHDVERLIPKGEIMEATLTDPPYGIQYKSNHRKEKFDVLHNDEHILSEWLPIAALRTKGWIVFFCAWQRLDEWMQVGKQIGDLTNLLIWRKSSAMGDLSGSFAPTFEVALAYNRGEKLQCQGRPSAVFDYNTEAGVTFQHPTTKPVALIADILSSTTRSSVFDPFLGSGTTLIAAEQLGRKCYGMEISPQYCDVIVKRWENLTGQKAILESSNGTA